ncbi:unnamed protein product [Trichobilharzia regenti]|nr:unnamed protein product [Trichobilharzia regenti]
MHLIYYSNYNHYYDNAACQVIHNGKLMESFEAVLSGISFRTYISDGWNKLDCAGLALYIVGFILRLIVLLRLGGGENINFEHERYYIVTDPILDPSRICLAISLFTFYIRLMYTFSFHIALGPKLIMIGKMVSSS